MLYFEDGEHTTRGERFVDACDSMADCPEIVAVGINCTPPQHVTSLLKQAQPIKDKKTLLVYPNSGELWTDDKKWVVIQLPFLLL